MSVAMATIPGATGAGASALLIGWASEDVSPPQPVMLYGQFDVRVSKGVKDPLTVTALAIEAANPAGANDRAVLISCDLCSVPPPILEQVRRRVRERVPDFDVRKLLMNATHTHAAPMPVEGLYPPQGPEVMSPSAYGDFFVERAATAAVAAWANRKPGGISWAFSHAVAGHSRLTRYMNPNFVKMSGSANDPRFDCMEGYADHDVNLLFTWDSQDKLTGAIIALAAPAQVDGAASFATADFWHDVRVNLRATYGESLFILPQCSAAGDLSWEHPVNRRAEERMWKLKGINARQAIARAIAAAVADGLAASRRDIQRKVLFGHAVEDLELPVRKVTDEELAFAKGKADYYAAQCAQSPGAANANYMQRNYYQDVVERYEKQKAKPKRSVEVHVLRLGDVAFATNPFELFAEYGLRIKARSPAVQTFVVQLAGGDPDAGAGQMTFCESYLPTERAVQGATPGKSYSVTVMDNRFGPEAGQALVERTLRMIDALWLRK